jgi:hypothetical protein
MSRVFGKLGFVHRRLWRDNGLYRASLLFGPAPLFGCLLALGIWKSYLAVQAWTYRPPAWAAPQHSDTWNTASDQPQVVGPDQPLPPTGPNGTLAGYETGSRVTVNAIEVNSQMDVNLKPNPMSVFYLDGPSFDMKQIMGQGPQAHLYAAVGSNFLPVRTAGIYSLSARFDRQAGPPADCLIRLGFGSRRIVSTLEVDIIENVSKTFDAARFDLQPGLYKVAWAFTCWHEHDVIGPGRMTLLVSHPGESGLIPARPDDIVRPEPVKH